MLVCFGMCWLFDWICVEYSLGFVVDLGCKIYGLIGYTIKGVLFTVDSLAWC